MSIKVFRNKRTEEIILDNILSSIKKELLFFK